MSRTSKTLPLAVREILSCMAFWGLHILMAQVGEIEDEYLYVLSTRAGYYCFMFICNDDELETENSEFLSAFSLSGKS